MNSKGNKYHPHELVKSLAKQLKTTSETDYLEEIIILPFSGTEEEVKQMIELLDKFDLQSGGYQFLK